MTYRNRTFVSFASEDIKYYRLMTAWNSNRRMEFNFHDAHDINTARDTSSYETICRRLRERLANTKQIVMLIGDITRSKAARRGTFINAEVSAIQSMDIPLIFANLNGAGGVQKNRIPELLLEEYTVSVPFGVEPIKYALDNFPDEYSRERNRKSGPHQYSRFA